MPVCNSEKSTSAEYYYFKVISEGCSIKTKADIKNINFCAHAIDATDKSSAYSNESCRSLSVWGVVVILEVFRLLLGNEGSGSQFSPAHY